MKKKIFITLGIVLLIINVFLLQILEKQRIQTVSNLEVGRLKCVWHGPRDKKIVALTFDDGPNPKYTPAILDLLKQYNVKATFFVLGKHAEKYPEILKRESLEGHEIGNHTFNHINIKKSSQAEIKREFLKTQNIIFSITEVMPKNFRPPYGLYNKSLINMIEGYGAKIIIWSTTQDSRDWSNPGVNKIINETLSKTKNGDIILLHDHVEYKESNTVEALKTILPELKKRGYKFITISQLIEITD